MLGRVETRNTIEFTIEIDGELVVGFELLMGWFKMVPSIMLAAHWLGRNTRSALPAARLCPARGWH
jgi:hypothetical protein